MGGLRFSRSGSQLPFLLRDDSFRPFQYRVFRVWRSRPRFLRSIALFVLALIVLVFVYSYFVLESKRSSSLSAKSVSRAQKISHSSKDIVLLEDAENVELTLVEKEKISNLDKNINSSRSGLVYTLDIVNTVKPNYPIFEGPRNERQRAVVSAFKHAWNGYKKFAWGYDQLMPLSGGYSEWFGTGLTIIDSLDTMLIMGLDHEFAAARTWVHDSLSFDNDRDVSFFETTIRVLGGLLSAYHLSGDRLFLEKATDLGGRLMGAFHSITPIPFSDVNLLKRTGRQGGVGGASSLSEVTTVQMEFRDLARLTNISTFEEISFKVNEHIHRIGCKNHDGLCGMFINPITGQFQDRTTITMGARSDSYYEYLLKQWLQTGKKIEWLKEDFEKSVESIKKYLIRESVPHNLTFVGELLAGSEYSPKMDHLVCFLGGTLALASVNGFPQSYLELGKALAEGCHAMYDTPTGLWPEIIYFNLLPGQSKDISIKPLDAHCILRPEAVETWFYLYRITGDKTYQDWGWKAFEALEKHAKVLNGYASVVNVKHNPVRHKDLMESFFLAETLKYFYLLFADDDSDIPLNKYVFNTEGHPLPIYDH